MNQALMPFPSLERSAGALVSATRTSPFGSTYNQRGWSRSRAKAVTTSPGAATGLPSLDQPFASAILTVGMSDVLGPGSSGVGPVPAETGRRAVRPHAAEPSTRYSPLRPIHRTTISKSLIILPPHHAASV